jgi:hypothetical protein
MVNQFESEIISILLFTPQLQSLRAFLDPSYTVSRDNFILSEL